MANKSTHAKRSGYSAHQIKPFSMFESRARVKKAKKEQAKSFASILKGGKA